MDLSSHFLIIAIVGLIVISLLLAIPDVRGKLVGNSNIRNGLVPLITAGFLWVLGSATDMLKGRIEESTVPADVLYVHIQSVDFGLPQLTGDYLKRDFSSKEVKLMLAPFTGNERSLNLTDDEIDRLNAITEGSGAIGQIYKDADFTTKDMADSVTNPLLFAFNYADWAKSALAWANLLDGVSKDPDRVTNLKKLIDAIQLEPTSAGLFQGVIGMVWRDELSIPNGQGDCLSASNNLVTVEESKSDIYLSFPTFSTSIVRTDSPAGRKQSAAKFASLFTHSCLNTLSLIFRRASTRFHNEAETMKRFVDEWNRILASKQPETIRIRVAISNVGRFDSFVRDTAKVSVGPIGASDPLSFTVAKLSSGATKASDDEEQAPPETGEGFIQIKSRASVIAVFYAHVSDNLKDKLYGAYQSEQGYLRLGILASAGAAESLVLSQVAPFSSKAKLLSKKLIDDAVVPINR